MVLILMVTLFAYGEMKSIRSTYQISAEDMPSPYSLFDRVLLLNSYTKYDYMDLQDRAMRDPKVFLDNEYLNKENNYLKEKYSFLAVIVDGGFTFLEISTSMIMYIGICWWPIIIIPRKAASIAEKKIRNFYLKNWAS